MHLHSAIPNTAEEVNGVAFKKHKTGMISVEPLTEEEHAMFAGIPGYTVVDAKGEAAELPAKTPAKTDKKHEEKK